MSPAEAFAAWTAADKIRLRAYDALAVARKAAEAADAEANAALDAYNESFSAARATTTAPETR
jgi:hypothetical protein